MKLVAKFFTAGNRKNSILWGIATVVVCLATIFAFKTLYLVSEDMKGVEILSNQNEAFVKVAMHKSFVVGSLPQILWRQIMAFVSFPDDHSHNDMLLWHIKNGNIERYEFKRFEPGGGMFPFKGTIHYTIGVEKQSDWPAVWRWTGSSFQKLEKAEAESIRNSYQLRSELIAREGWHDERPDFTSEETVISLSFTTNEFALVLKEKDLGDSRNRTLLLRSGKNKTEERTLVRTSDSYRLVGRQMYLDSSK